MQTLLLLNFIVPFVMILVGVLLRKHPVSDKNSQNGYNTPVARRSQAHWDYAQQIAPGIFISLGTYLGIAEIILCLILLRLKVSLVYSVIIGEVIAFAVLIYGFYHTDRRIKKKFSC